MVKFYNEMPEMEFFSGDTLPFFTVEVDSQNLENCTMSVTFARANDPKNSVFCKDCVRTPTGFLVRITSDETAQLNEGAYVINFRMTDADGLSYIKLSGTVYVRSAAGV
ncbi:MAG: hypothetical protein K2J44_09630 [Ruminococcus sp.]|nr:hypothetical protein [Ruminococcus sp.]